MTIASRIPTSTRTSRKEKEATPLKDYQMTPAQHVRYEEELRQLIEAKQGREKQIKTVQDQLRHLKVEGNRVDRRIDELQRLLTIAEIVPEESVPTTEGPMVRQYTRVQIRDEETGSTKVWTIVPAAEAHASTGYISDASPLGRGLMGHILGERVTIRLPLRVAIYTILAIEPRTK